MPLANEARTEATSFQGLEVHTCGFQAERWNAGRATEKDPNPRALPGRGATIAAEHSLWIPFKAENGFGLFFHKLMEIADRIPGLLAHCVTGCGNAAGL